MSIDHSELLELPPAEQLQIIELLWENLLTSTEPLPLPEWAETEGLRRLHEIEANPGITLDHETVWRHIANRNA